MNKEKEIMKARAIVSKTKVCIRAAINRKLLLHHGWLTEYDNNTVRWWSTRTNRSINPYKVNCTQQAVVFLIQYINTQFKIDSFWIFIEWWAWWIKDLINMYDMEARAQIRLMNSYDNNEQMPSPPHPNGNRIRENCTILCLSHQVKKAVRDKSLDVCSSSSSSYIVSHSHWIINIIINTL
jgi:hypothetical protein